jgi:hypothetical protein
VIQIERKGKEARFDQAYAQSHCSLRLHYPLQTTQLLSPNGPNAPTTRDFCCVWVHRNPTTVCTPANYEIMIGRLLTLLSVDLGGHRLWRRARPARTRAAELVPEQVQHQICVADTARVGQTG